MMTMMTTPSEIIHRLRFLHQRAFSCRRCWRFMHCISSAASTSDSEPPSAISGDIFGAGGRGRNAATHHASGKMKPMQNEYTWTLRRPNIGSLRESSEGARHPDLACWRTRRSGSKCGDQLWWRRWFVPLNPPSEDSGEGTQ